jgi:hypothetical protein
MMCSWCGSDGLVMLMFWLWLFAKPWLARHVWGVAWVVVWGCGRMWSSESVMRLVERSQNEVCKAVH